VSYPPSEAFIKKTASGIIAAEVADRRVPSTRAHSQCAARDVNPEPAD
jgi:hypothetical protein